MLPAGKMLCKSYGPLAKLFKEKFKSRDSKILLALAKYVVVRFCTHPGIPCADWLQTPSQHADLQLFAMGIPLTWHLCWHNLQGPLSRLAEGKPKIIDVALPTKSQNPLIITKVPFQLRSFQKSILFRDVAVIEMRFGR